MEKIVHFLSSNFLLSLALIIGEEPYAINAFYVFDKKRIALIFASSPNSLHFKVLKTFPKVAGTIACCSLEISSLQGVQFKGEIQTASLAQKLLYLKKFPYVLGKRPTFWEIKLNWIKMTDNSRGFGKKLIWTTPLPDC